MRRAINRPIALWGLVLLLAGVISPGTTGLFTNPPAGGNATIGEAGSPHSGPVMFIENAGQFDERARFKVWGDPGTMWLTEDAIWITVLERSDKEAKGPEDTETIFPSPPHLVPPSPQRGVNLRLTFPGANPHPRLEPFGRLNTVVSYFIGNAPDRWHPDVPVWAGVRYVDLYPGVDLVVGAIRAPAQGQPHGSPLPWRLETHHDTDLSTVRLRVEGADALTLDGNTLHITTAVGNLTLPLLQAVAHDGTPLDLPAVPPEANGPAITSPFSPPSLPRPSIRLSADHSLSQDSPDNLLYSTFLGGSGSDDGYGIAVDDAGNAYVTGGTHSSNFPTTTGAFDTSYNSGDLFVVKLNANGTGLVYATFLGGSDEDGGGAIAVDGVGNAYVTGVTLSSDFPTTTGTFDTSYNGGWDAFAVELNPSGMRLVYATFLGGSDNDAGNAITVDGTGSAYASGETKSSDFPTTAGAFDTSYNGGFDTFVINLNAGGDGLTYATFLGSSTEQHNAIAVDSVGSAYVTGTTTASDFPTTAGAFDASHNGGIDAFVVKLNSSGTGLIYATFLGGSGDECRWGICTIAVDEAGSAYVTGRTSSSDFPTTAGAFDTSYNGDEDAFIVKLNSDGTRLTYATFLGGSGIDCEWNCPIAVDAAGNVYTAGRTRSSDFPTTAGAFDTSYNGGLNDAFVVKMNAAGTELAYASFLGGSNEDYGIAIAVDEAGNAYVTGGTLSSNFPTTAGAFDTSHNGSRDAFVAKLAVEGPTPTPTPTPGPPTLTPTPGPSPTATPTLTWDQVNTDGFGDPRNVGAIRSIVFGQYLYVSTFNSTTGTQIWRTHDGTTWTQVNVGGFGDSHNLGTFSFGIFNGYLYAGTWNTGTGAQVWRTLNGTSWEKANQDGFGAGDAAAEAMVVFEGCLYVGTRNDSEGARIWRTCNGTTWTMVAGSIGDAGNWLIQRLASFNGYLYAGTNNPNTGTEVWRSSDGVSWRQVNTDGFGDAGNLRASSMTVFQERLYAGTYNPTTGAEIWRSSGGTTWDQVNIDGFGDAQNDDVGSLVAFEDKLYAGVGANAEAGGAKVLSSEDGVAWTQVNVDGFGDTQNKGAFAMTVWGNGLYAGTWNDSTGAEMWRMLVVTPTPTATVTPFRTPTPSATATMTPTPIHGLLHEAYLPLVRRNPAPALTPTPTATPVPPVCDAGFENGPTFAPCWSHGGELPARPVTQLYNDDPPHTGHYSALLGNPDWGVGWPDPIPAGSAWIEQRIQVPNTSNPRLTFFYRIASYDVMQGTRLWDTLDVTINGITNVVFRDGPDRPPANQGTLYDGGWKLTAVDLGAWRGQEVALRFAVWNREYDPRDGTDYYNTWVYLDEVEITP